MRGGGGVTRRPGEFEVPPHREIDSPDLDVHCGRAEAARLPPHTGVHTVGLGLDGEGLPGPQLRHQSEGPGLVVFTAFPARGGASLQLGIARCLFRALVE